MSERTDFDRVRAANCPSTHCNRSEECRSPHECCSPAKTALAWANKTGDAK